MISNIASRPCSCRPFCRRPSQACPPPDGTCPRAISRYRQWPAPRIPPPACLGPRARLACSSSAPPAHTRRRRPAPPHRPSSQASIPVSSSQPPFRISSPSTFLHHSLHGEHHAEPRLAAQHAIVGGSGLFEREGLHHGPNPGEGTKVERVFRGSGGARRAPL